MLEARFELTYLTGDTIGACPTRTSPRLAYPPDGELVLHTFAGKDVSVPAYAILSHTWAKDGDQKVSFQDVEAGMGSGKAGFKKIKFGADQGAVDGLQYFWIDTCCIDKKNAVELPEAINSHCMSHGV